MWTFVRASSQVSAAALALLALSPAGPGSGAMAAQFSVGVIEYNAKESQGGWTTQYGNVLAKQIKLIVDKIRDKSNPSPVQFIALDQAKAESRACIANDDTLVSCALEHNQLPGWTTIVSDCEPEQVELAYSKDWKLVVAPNTTNPLVDGYHSDDPAKYRNVCWAGPGTGNDQGRPYNIAYFENVASKETVLFVIVHMPHQYPDNCTGSKCYGGKYYWDIPQFKRDVQTVVGANVDLTKVHLIAAGDMNDLGNDAVPAKFASIFGDFGAVTVSAQAIVPPYITCCANDGYTAGLFDRIVTNSTVTPKYSVIDPNIYPLNKNKVVKHNRVNKEHKATYGEVIFP